MLYRKETEYVGYVVVKEQLNILLVLMSYKHFYLPSFIQKVLTSAHNVGKRRPIIRGCSTPVAVCKSPRFIPIHEFFGVLR
jgi:hypothetical protein